VKWDEKVSSISRMPLKRRSSVGPGLHRAQNGTNGFSSSNENDSTPVPDTTIIPGADEESERRQRVRGLQKRNSFGGAGAGGGAGAIASPAVIGAVGGPETPSAVSGYSAAQLAAHYTDCIKLSAENKITHKNAFKMKLIDYMADMFTKRRRGGEEGLGGKGIGNFQEAAAGLDACSKIYASKVDIVHSETLKLAQGVTSSRNHEGDERGADGGGGDGEGEEDAKKRLRRKKKSNTVEKNLANINCAKFELEFDIDPLFKKVSAQFDSGAGGGQFLSTLQIRDDSCEMLLDSTARIEPIIPAAEQAADEEMEDVELPEDAPWPKIEEDLLVCPTFAKFSFNGWSLEKEEADDPFNLSASQNADVDANNDLDNDEHAFDVDAPCHIDAQDDDHEQDNDVFGDVIADDYENLDLAGAAVRAVQKPAVSNADVQTLRDHLAAVPTEYSYFDHGRLGTWAGPKHWKFKAGPKGSYRADLGTGAAATADGGKKKQQKKEKDKVDFGKLESSEELIADFVERAMTVPKRAIKLQNKTMQNWSDEKTMQPEDLHYSGNDFVKLENVVKSNVAPLKRAADADTAVDDDDVRDYDFDNLNDSQNFCPNLPSTAGDDDDTTNGGEFTGVFSQTVMAPENSGIDGLGLVSAPNRVEKIQIGYAKTAKKVDMRRLKTVQWNILLSKSRELTVAENKENDGGDLNKAEETTGSDGEKTVLAGDMRFSDIYQELRRTDKLPSKMQEGLSVPLAFVALLHLCNEQTLQLENSKDFADFLIRSG
jgi:condensin complex subunit 2